MHMHDFLAACIQLDPIAILKAGGYLGVAAIIFVESGLLIGIFLPGDSLLFAAGLLSGGGALSFPLLAGIVALAAVLGDSVGYWLGVRTGGALMKRPDSRFFKREYLLRTKQFYEQYGGRAVMLARFVPIVRTLAPLLAGAGAMRYARFLSYNILGGLLWGIGMLSLGYSLGAVIPGSEHYLLPISLAIIAVSFLPVVTNFTRARTKSRKDQIAKQSEPERI